VTTDELPDPASLLMLLDDQETLVDSLTRLVNTCRDAIPACSDATVTMVRAGGPTSAATTSERGRAIDEWEYATDSGPCIDTLKDGQEHYTPSRGETEMWPGFSEVLERAGIETVLGVPLEVGGVVVGALNVFAEQQHAFDDEASREIARQVAAQVATTVHNLRVYDASRTLAQQLETAMQSRAVIEQAKGILMAQASCDADEAFEVLRRASQRENVKLRDVAERIVSSVAKTPAR
jgi:GAF domain-containing protein